jgi:hypothetical protein
MRTVLAVAIVMAATPLLAAAQPASDVVDPNAQTEGTSASLNGVKLGASNPWGLTAVRAGNSTDRDLAPAAAPARLLPKGQAGRLQYAWAAHAYMHIPSRSLHL